MASELKPANGSTPGFLKLILPLCWVRALVLICTPRRKFLRKSQQNIKAVLLLLLLGGVLGVTTTTVQASSQSTFSSIKITSREDSNATYAIAMLELALKKAEIEYSLDITKGKLSTIRLREGMDNNAIDVIWTATSGEMENNYLSVRIPLYKGLLGCRILIVHKDNQHLFKSVTTMEDVLARTYGQGHGWSDTAIMRANGLEVVSTPKYQGLFHMVDGKRFDAFPRGVHEPWGEVAKRPELDLVIDQNIMLVYQMPFYLFVSNHRPELAEVITHGFELAIADGSFDALFFNDPTVKMVLQKASVSQRQIFTLKNPDLPLLTPLARQELWFDVTDVDDLGAAHPS